jgi:hypothetical protein
MLHPPGSPLDAEQCRDGHDGCVATASDQPGTVPRRFELVGVRGQLVFDADTITLALPPGYGSLTLDRTQLLGASWANAVGSAYPSPLVEGVPAPHRAILVQNGYAPWSVSLWLAEIDDLPSSWRRRVGMGRWDALLGRGFVLTGQRRLLVGPGPVELVLALRGDRLVLRDALERWGFQVPSFPTPH